MRCFRLGPNGANWYSVTWGRFCHLSVSQFIRSMPKKFLKRWCGSILVCMPANVLDYWKVLTLWFLPFQRRQFYSRWSAESLWKMRPEWGNCFLFIFWLHSSCSQVSGTCKWKTCWGSTWLISNFCLVPLSHWPLNYLLACLGCVAAAERGGWRSIQYGWHVPCFPTACHM